MPSPFPGMDPYLENPAGWQSFHTPFMSDIADVLNAELPHRYVARVDERCYILNPKRTFIPDVSIKRRPSKTLSRRDSGGVVTLSRRIDPALVVRLEPFDVREGFVNVL